MNTYQKVYTLLQTGTSWECFTCTSIHTDMLYGQRITHIAWTPADFYMFIYIYICVYIYICMYMHITQTQYICIYIYTIVHQHMHIHRHIYIYMHKYIDTHMYIYIHICLLLCIYASVYIYIIIIICVYIYICITCMSWCWIAESQCWQLCMLPRYGILYGSVCIDMHIYI